MPLVTVAGAARIAIILLAGAGVLALCWWLMIRMPLDGYRGGWISLDENGIALRDRLRADVEQLAGSIGERNVFTESSLDQAAEFIEASLAEGGRPVKRFAFRSGGKVCFNIESEIPGGARQDEIVVVGAHYDSVAGSPGANDNGSGVAALLELARSFADSTPSRTLRFVAFANEEPPFFMTGEMGSRVYAREARERGDVITAMISLETIGYYTEAPGSQRYPLPLGGIYPTTGDFIAFVGNLRSRALVRDAIAVFRRTTSFPSEGAALPGWVPGIGWSDHWSFWRAGYPAIMVTDTAPFRYPYYHQASDTPEKLNYDRFARVVSGLHHVVSELAEPD